MINSTSEINALRRPRLLIRTALAAAHIHDRNQSRTGQPDPLDDKSRIRVINQLLQQELELETERVEQNAVYSVRKHISVLTALMIESYALDQHRLAA